MRSSVPASASATIGDGLAGVGAARNNEKNRHSNIDNEGRAIRYRAQVRYVRGIHSFWIVLLVCSLAVGQSAVGATLLETTELVARTPQSEALLPPAMTFTVATAGRYTITLRDLQTPVPLSSLRAVVTRDLKVVAQVAITPVTAPNVPLPATANFMAAAGDYRVHVLGEPKTGEPGGAFGVSVAPTEGGASLLDHADVIAAEPQPAAGQSVLRADLVIPAPGTYQITLTDHSFAPTTTSTSALVLRETQNGVDVVPITGGSFTVADAGAYELLVAATAAGGELAGLYTVSVAGGPAAAVVYQSVQPAGRTMPPATFTFGVAGQYVLDAKDLRFPAALASRAAALVQGISVLGRQTDDNPVTVTAIQGAAQLFALGTASAADGVGAMSLSVTQGSQAIYADTRAVDASDDPATPTINVFTSAAAAAAGNYTLTLKDQAFPTSLPLLKAAVVQGATLIHEQGSQGSADIALQAAPVRILVATKPPAANGNGLFTVLVAPQAGGATLLESTQGVGGLFKTQLVQIGAAGAYDITLADLEFPARLESAALAITSGTTLSGQIFGSGTIPRQQLAAGTYALHFLGQASLGAKYGVYGLRVADSPPQPTVTLTANPASVTSGQTTSLQWNAANATTCSASAGWTGSKATSGTEQSTALTAATTFTITCTGPGGSANASVSVTVNAPPSNSRGGGGGAMGVFGVLSLMLLAVSRSGRLVRRR